MPVRGSSVCTLGGFDHRTMTIFKAPFKGLDFYYLCSLCTHVGACQCVQCTCRCVCISMCNVYSCGCTSVLQCACRCVHISMYNVYSCRCTSVLQCACRCPERPEERRGFPGAGVVEGCAPPNREAEQLNPGAL